MFNKNYLGEFNIGKTLFGSLEQEGTLRQKGSRLEESFTVKYSHMNYLKDSTMFGT